MRTRDGLYWTATILAALPFLSGSAIYLAHADFAVKGLAALGYPAYLVTLLGIWKGLGAIAILVPGFPRLKEWAYAGITFDLTGAAWSHVASGDARAHAMVPLAILAIVAASWALRPASRSLASAAAREG